MHQILFGSNNVGKLKEVRKIAAKFGIAVVSPADLGIDITVIEDGATFYENALKKYHAYADAIKGTDEMYVMTDDSGIEIDALNNEPGVRTRRWLGYEMTDYEIATYCLERMDGLEGDARKAQFKTVIVLGGHDVTEPIVTEGILPGRILRQTSVDQENFLPGLPFNRIFMVDELGMLLSDFHQKSTVLPVETHRHQAVRKALEKLRKHNMPGIK